MAHYLPPPIMAFFQPRPVYDSWVITEKKKQSTFMGVAPFLHRFNDVVPLPIKNLTPVQKKDARDKKRADRAAVRLAKHVAKWDPKTAERATEDAYKTLFVGRLAYDVSEDDIKAEFEYYGPIKRVRLVKNKKTGKSRGYAFVEFEHSSHLKEAYKEADGCKIRGRRICVDVERGRTVKNWKPRRLGGGSGGTRAGGKEVNQKYSGREPPAGGVSASAASSSSSSSSSGSSSTSSRRDDRSRSDRSSRSDRRSRSRERSSRSDKGSERDRSSRSTKDSSSSSSSRKRSRSRSKDRSRSPKRSDRR